ncbi:hypothetical protein AB0C14_14850 [Microbispora hainanensis]|uniref:hypothetical protein n=1 Tax=Microbispora hainanensis TaxID=568844 RepID=UPI0033D77F02
MDIRSVSRIAGAVSLIVGPLALAVPIEVTDENAPITAQLHDYANHPALAMLSNIVLLPVMLILPAMIYAARLARRGAPRQAFVGAGLWRSRAVAPWVAALFIAYPVGHLVGHAISPVIDTISGVLLLVSAVAVAIEILRTPNRQWDLPPGEGVAPAEPVAGVAA